MEGSYYKTTKFYIIDYSLKAVGTNDEGYS